MEMTPAHVEWIMEFTAKEMRRLFEGKRFDIPSSLRKDIAVSIEKAARHMHARLTGVDDGL